jgi:hypothetical protein
VAGQESGERLIERFADPAHRLGADRPAQFASNASPTLWIDELSAKPPRIAIDLRNAPGMARRTPTRSRPTLESPWRSWTQWLTTVWTRSQPAGPARGDRDLLSGRQLLTLSARRLMFHPPAGLCFRRLIGGRLEILIVVTIKVSAYGTPALRAV